ncbi:MAG: hypothetical protein ACI8UO_002811 [Verrucomicrobiales bacterium]|jgi:hypothetical protein
MEAIHAASLGPPDETCDTAELRFRQSLHLPIAHGRVDAADVGANALATLTRAFPFEAETALDFFPDPAAILRFFQVFFFKHAEKDYARVTPTLQLH